MKHVQAHQVKTRECIFSTDNRLTGRLQKKKKKLFVYFFLFSWRNLRFGGEHLEEFALMMSWGDEVWWRASTHRFSCRNCQINAEINLYVLDYLTETIDEFWSLNFSTFRKRATLKSAPSTLISQPVIKVYFKTFINYYCYFAALSRASSKMVCWALSTTHCARC